MELEIPPLCGKLMTKYASNSRTPVYFRKSVFDWKRYLWHSPRPGENYEKFSTQSLSVKIVRTSLSRTGKDFILFPRNNYQVGCQIYLYTRYKSGGNKLVVLWPAFFLYWYTCGEAVLQITFLRLWLWRGAYYSISPHFLGGWPEEEVGGSDFNTCHTVHYVTSYKGILG